jgi:hypothetical protein
VEAKNKSELQKVYKKEKRSSSSEALHVCVFRGEEQKKKEWNAAGIKRRHCEEAHHIFVTKSILSYSFAAITQSRKKKNETSECFGAAGRRHSTCTLHFRFVR